MTETDEEKQARLKKEAEEQAAKEREEAAAAAAKAKQDKKYSDEEVDRMFDKKFAERQAKLEKKYGNLDELLAKAEELDKLKDSGKGEIEKLTDKLAKSEKKIVDIEAAKTKAELDLRRLTVLLGVDDRLKNVPNALKYISGNTDDEIKASITELSTLGFSLLPKGDGNGKDPFADLKNKAAQGAGKTPPAAAGSGEVKAFTRSQLKAMSKEEYAANRDAIMAASAANKITQD